MASEAGDEEASASAASVASGSDDGEKSSHGSVQATGADDDVVEVEDKPRAASEEAGQQQQEQQKQLPDGWLAHSICGKLYDGNLYEEIKGGRPGQDPSTVNAYAVFGKVDKKPKCLVCVHSGSSTHAHNYLGHLRKHKEFVEYEASLGKGESKEGGKGNGAGGACTCGGGGTFKWSEERKARVRRLLICMIVVHGRPFEMLRNELFQKLIKDLSCGEMLCPSTQTLRLEVEQLAKNVKADLVEKIKNAQPGTRSISADGWTAGNQTGRMGMILRFVDKDTLEFMSVVLGCMLWDEDHDAAGTAAMMRKVFERWGVTHEDVDMACTDNASVMKACIRDYFGGWKWLGCTPHTLQLPLTRLLEGKYQTVHVAGPDGGRRSETTQQQWAGPGPERVHLLFKSARRVMNFHTNRPNSKLQHLLHNMAVAAGEEEGEHVRAFIKPGDTRWTGLYLMGTALRDNHDYTVQFSYKNPGASDCCLTPEEYRLMCQVLAVLEPFANAMNIFQTTDSVAISLIYPELLHIIATLEAAEVYVGEECVPVASLDPAVVDLRQQLRAELNERLFHWDGTTGEVYKNFTLYGSAAYLDPRNIGTQEQFQTVMADGRTIFHHMGKALYALGIQNKAEIAAFLQRELARSPHAPWVARATTLDGGGAAPAAAAAAAARGPGDGPPPAKRSRDWRSHMTARLLGGGGSGSGVGGSGGGGAGGVGGGVLRPLVMKEEWVSTLLLEEMEKYARFWTDAHVRVHGLPLPKEDMCPLKLFWALHRESMPVLCFLAHTTLSIRPSSADCERLFSTAGFVYDEPRQCLDEVRLDDLLVIKGNWDAKYLEFTNEEQEAKKAARLHHNKAISAAMKEAHAAKAKKRKASVQSKLFVGAR